MWKLLPLAGLAAVLAGPALAQSPAPSAAAPSPAAPGGFIARADGSLPVSRLFGVPVNGQDHVKVGDIEDVLLDREGRIEAVVLAVGGVLGMGTKSVAVPFEFFAWNTGEVSRAQTPSASVTEGNAPSEVTGATASPERMPGAQVSDRTLAAVEEHRSGAVDAATGSVAAGAPPATVRVTRGDRAPERAEVRLTRADLRAAPAFRYQDRDGGRR